MEEKEFSYMYDDTECPDADAAEGISLFSIYNLPMRDINIQYYINYKRIWAIKKEGFPSFFY